MEQTIEALVKQAKEGNKDSLEALIRRIQDRVYGLAMRMLFYPSDAEDATQEILIKVVIHLDSFRLESAFTTWVYHIACNHLSTIQKCRAERIEMTFQKYGEMLDKWLSNAPSSNHLHVEQHLIVKEIMLRCMQGMLICLDRDSRIAYILGEIFEITGDKAAIILNTTPIAFRKRLSRARTHLRNFMQKKCGLVNPANSCRCSRLVNYAIKSGFVNPDRLLFAGHPCHAQMNVVTSNQINEMKEIERMAALFHNHPDYVAPETFVEGIKKLVDLGKYKIFDKNASR